MEKSLKNTKKPMGLSTKIFIALIAGAISGVLIHYLCQQAISVIQLSLRVSSM